MQKKYPYLLPLVFLVFVLISIALWVVWQWNMVEVEIKDRLERPALGTLDALEVTIHAQSEDGFFHKKELQKVVDSVLHVSRMKFIGIFHNEQLIVRAGSNKSIFIDASAKSVEGTETAKNIVVAWRMLQFFGADKHNNSREFDLDLRKANLKLVIVYESSFYHRIRERYHDGVLRSAYLMTVIAIFIIFVWISSIRNHVLQQELNIQKTRADYLEDMEFSAAGLAHETKNPLSIIRGLAQQIHESSSGENHKIAEDIMESVDQATSKLGDFMAYAKARKPKIEKIEVSSLLSKITRILQTHSSTVVFEEDYRVSYIYADKGMLKQIMTNLLLNSLEASREGGKVKISLLPGAKHACLMIEDEGEGIDPQLLEKIFKPYVTGKPNGHGLGLAIVKRMIDLHDWKISVTSMVDKGTTVVIDHIKMEN